MVNSFTTYPVGRQVATIKNEIDGLMDLKSSHSEIYVKRKMAFYFPFRSLCINCTCTTVLTVPDIPPSLLPQLLVGILS